MFWNLKHITLSLLKYNGDNQVWILKKMLFRIANREDPDQTASSEAVWSGYLLFVKAFLAGN